MITDDEVLSLFEQADPARTTDDRHEAQDAAGYLAALRQRSNDVTYIHPTENWPASPRRHRFAMIAAAAAVVLVIGALVLAARGDDEGQEVPATVPPTVPVTTVPTSGTPPTSTPAPAVAAGPVAQAEAFLAAIETGEPADVQALLAPEFESRQWMGPLHQAAAGAAYVDPSCNVSPSEPSVVVCGTSITLAAHRLTNTNGAPVSLIVTVGEDGITAMDIAVQNLGLLPFEDWKETNWPGGLPIEVDEITTVEQLVEYARVEVELAEAWGAAAVSTVEGAFADFNAGDVDAFTARFVTVDRFAPTDVVAASLAGGQQYDVMGCTTDGIEPMGLAVVCDVVVRHGSFDATGVEAAGTYRMVVTVDREIVVVTNAIDVDSIDALDNSFEQWLLAAHPDVHTQVTWVDVGENRIPSADDQVAVAPYYEEFVAQSDAYPLGG